MENLKKTKLQMIKRSVIVLILSSLLIVFFTQNIVYNIIGVLIGMFAGLFAFFDLAITLQNSTLKTPPQAQKYAVMKYLLRYIIVGLILFLAFKTSEQRIGTVFGLLSIKIIVYSFMFDDLNFFKNIFKKGGKLGK